MCLFLFLCHFQQAEKCSFLEATVRFLSFKFQVKIKLRDTALRCELTPMMSFPLAANLPCAQYLRQVTMGVSRC